MLVAPRVFSRTFPGWRWGAAVIGIYSAAAILFTYPLATGLADHLPYEPFHDQLYQLSLLEFETSSLLSSPGQFFSGNIFFGSGDALYSSDLLLGLLALFAPLRWATGHALMAFNLAYLLAFVLNALSMYWAGSVLTRSRAGALAAGAVYAFGAIQINYAFHLQFLAAWWLPLAIVFAVRFSRTLSARDFGLALLLAGIQFATGVHLGIMAGIAVLGFAAPAVVTRIVWRRNWRALLSLLIVGSLVSLPFLPLVLGYQHYASLWQAERTLSDVQFWSVELPDYLSPTARLRWYDGLAAAFPMPYFERTVFPGFVPAGLGALGLLVGLRGRRHRALALTAAGILILGLAFSLGPHWKWDDAVTSVKLPYLALFENVSAFRAIRVVARFSLLVHLGLSLLTAAAVAWAAGHRWSTRFPVPVAGLLATVLILGETLPTQLPIHPLVERPQLTEALREAGPGPTLFIPIRRTDVDWRYGAEAEIERMWLAARTGVGPLVNGYSGYIWDKTEHFQSATVGRSARDAADLAVALQAYGIRHVVLRTPSIPLEDVSMWDAFIRSPTVDICREAGDYVVVTLREVTPPAEFGWADLNVRLLVDSVEPDHEIVGALVLAAADDQPWVPPGGSHARTLDLKWLDSRDAVVSRSTGGWSPPPFLEPGQLQWIPIQLAPPTAPGEYQLVISVDGEQILGQVVKVGHAAKTPFRGTSEGLGARLILRTPGSVASSPGEQVPLHVDAVNTGLVDWAGDANIRLGWQWFERLPDGTSQPGATPEGRLPLLNHIFGVVEVGSGHPFSGAVAVPEAPGEYILRVGMLAELVAWFPGELIQIQVTVLSPDEARAGP